MHWKSNADESLCVTHYRISELIAIINNYLSVGESQFRLKIYLPSNHLVSELMLRCEILDSTNSSVRSLLFEFEMSMLVYVISDID